MWPRIGAAPTGVLQTDGLYRFLLEAPLRVILVVAGVALVLAAGGLTIPGRFEPDAFGRRFMGAVGVLLLVTGLLVHIGFPPVDGDGGDATTTAGPTEVPELTPTGAPTTVPPPEPTTVPPPEPTTVPPPEPTTVPPTEYPMPEGVDGALSSNSVHRQGEALWFRVPGADSGDVFEIREVDGERLGPLVTQVVVDGDGEAVLDTSNLLGRYVVYDPERERALEIDADGTASRTTDVSGAAWEVRAES
jgi:hypothetical protein